MRDKAIEVAAELMQAPAAALDIVDGQVVRTDRRRPVDQPWRDRRAPRAGAKTLRRARAGARGEGWFNAEHQVYPYGIHVAVVQVDRETGGVTVERYHHRPTTSGARSTRCW